MRSDSRLSRMLHVLLHMARQDAPFTSEQLAQMLATNPVVVRRTMAGLKKAGYVQSEKGHGGGWTLSCDLAAVSLLDIHQAVGGPRIFAIGSATEGLLAMQRNAIGARPRPIDGEQASRSYQRYLKSFETSIPEHYGTGLDLKKR